MGFDKMIDTSFLPKPIEGHMQLQEDIISLWTTVKDITNFKKLIEIGFNVGHSSTIILSLFDDVSINSFDINRNSRTQEGADLVKQKFVHRHNFFTYNTLDLRQDIINNKFKFPEADLIFIDGGHSYEVALNDIMIAKENNIRYILVDDSNMEEVSKAISSVLFLKEIKTFNYTYSKKKKTNSIEARLFELNV
jgi:hypothetical protein